jgi:hypothetical protein
MTGQVPMPVDHDAAGTTGPEHRAIEGAHDALGREERQEVEPGVNWAPQGYYSTVIIDNPPTDLFFRQVIGAPPPPDNLRQLKLDLEAAAQVVLTFFRGHPEKKLRFMERLRLAGQIGCCGPNYRVIDGTDSLESTKRQVVEEGYEQRNAIWYTYTRFTLLILVPTAVAGFIAYIASTYGFRLPPPDAKEGFAPAVTAVIAAFWIPAGAAFGVWTEFNFRTASLTFTDLLYFDPERWAPGQRFFIAIMIGFLLAFVLAFKIVQIGLFGILLNEFSGKHPEFSGAIGWVSGFAYPVVRDIIKTLRPTVRQQG